ncbi:MAG: DUF4105 domain-containing protein [Pseudoxanthomonas sp.]
MPVRRPWRRRCGALWLLLSVASLSTSAVQAGVPLQLDETGLDAAERAASAQLIGEVQARLPPAFGEALDKPIQLQWRKDLPARVHGRSRGARILLAQSLLDALRSASSSTPERASVASRQAQATLIHELAHLYDRSSHGGLSRNAQLLDLAGWQRRPLRPFSRAPSAMRDRSPDAYELTSPREFVAVNFEHFLLDPDYACRRPQLHAWLAQRVGMAPAHASCAQTLPFVEADAAAGTAQLLTLDPARVYAVDYLLAEGNAQAMSLWGHTMLRLVVCAPGRAPGPDCRLDLQYHLVLSFRAFVGDVQVSHWRGLTGSYPTRLYALPLEQVIAEYTRVELRGLRSVPLKLAPQQVAGVMQRAAQLHWNYDGRYYFISNNCAVESARLLEEGVPALADIGVMAMSPAGVLRRLRRAGIADVSVFDDMAVARRQGYYFEAASAHYQTLLEVLRTQAQAPAATVEQWFALAPAQRAAWFEGANLRATAAALLLEQAAARRAELEVRDALKRRYLGTRRGKGDALDRELQALFDTESRLARPAALLDDAPGAGYGLPIGSELTALQERGMDQALALADGWQRVRGQALAELSGEQRALLEGTQRNVEALSKRMREQARGPERVETAPVP